MPPTTTQKKEFRDFNRICALFQSNLHIRMKIEKREKKNIEWEISKKNLESFDEAAKRGENHIIEFIVNEWCSPLLQCVIGVHPKQKKKTWRKKN